MQADWTETPQSSSIARYLYDEASRTLAIEFREATERRAESREPGRDRGVGGNRIYCYLGVPTSAYSALRAARSKGAFVNREIKPRYRLLLLE